MQTYFPKKHTFVQKPNGSKRSNTRVTLRLLKQPTGGKFLTLKFSNNEILHALVDTGSTDNFLSTSYFNTIPKKDIVSVKPMYRLIQVGNGECIESYTEAVVMAEIGSLRMHVTFWLSDQCIHTAILGDRFTDKHDTIFLCARNALSIRPYATVLLTDPFVIPGSSEINVMGRVSSK